MSRLALMASFVVVGSVNAVADISFRNDVMPVLSKSGCNLGTCHGNAKGKGGFQISLRGQDPSGDYAILTRDLFGRRANPSDPDQSLMLLKPTMQMAYMKAANASTSGFPPSILFLRDWITGRNAGNDSAGSCRQNWFDWLVTPDEVFLRRTARTRFDRKKSKRHGSCRSHARRRNSPDGSSRDVTSLQPSMKLHNRSPTSRTTVVSLHGLPERPRCSFAT